MKKNSGFTLTELMIVVAIVGILIGVTVPRMISWRDEQQLNVAARQVHAALQRLRMQAIKDNNFVWFTFNDATHYQTVVWDRVTNRGLIWNRPISLQPGIQVQAGSIGWFLRFDSRGLSSSAVTYILKNKKGTTRRIAVTLTGISSIT